MTSSPITTLYCALCAPIGKYFPASRTEYEAIKVRQWTSHFCSAHVPRADAGWCYGDVPHSQTQLEWEAIKETDADVKEIKSFKRPTSFSDLPVCIESVLCMSICDVCTCIHVCVYACVYDVRQPYLLRIWLNYPQPEAQAARIQKRIKDYSHKVMAIRTSRKVLQSIAWLSFRYSPYPMIALMLLYDLCCCCYRSTRSTTRRRSRRKRR